MPSQTLTHTLLEEIKFFDCEPAVFRVTLSASDHTAGYDACVLFRPDRKGNTSSIRAHSDTPEGALDTLFVTLQQKWGKCKHCGAYQHPEKEN